MRVTMLSLVLMACLACSDEDGPAVFATDAVTQQDSEVTRTTQPDVPAAEPDLPGVEAGDSCGGCTDANAEVSKAPCANGCDDGLGCTIDTCSPEGLCVHEPGGCPAIDQAGKLSVCWVGQCHEDGSGACQSVKVAQAMKIPCNDDNACTVGEICSFGSCSNGVPIACPDDADACTEKKCDKDTGCTLVPTAENGPCNDGDSCTVDDTCTKGVGGKPGQCVGAKVTCKSGGNPCTIPACHPLLGCTADNVTDGTPCASPNLCYVSGTTKCVAGACEGEGPSVSAKPCFVQFCNPGTGAVTLVPTSNVPCDDGDPCTVGDGCTAGTCAGLPKCGTGTCNPATGECTG